VHILCAVRVQIRVEGFRVQIKDEGLKFRKAAVRCVAACCSVLQCVAVCCNVL